MVAAIVILLFPSLIGKPPEEGPAEKEKTTLVKIAEVTESEFADFVEAVGSTFAYESAEITPNVTEVVEKISFKDGQAVQKGDVIVVLRYSEESAQLRSARARLQEQDREIERLSGLVKSGAAAVSALDARNTQKQVAEQQIQQFQAQIADRIIRAPFDGVLGLRNISAGSLVSPQNVITTIDDLSTMRVDFTVPEVYLGPNQIRHSHHDQIRGVSRPDLPGNHHRNRHPGRPRLPVGAGAGRNPQRRRPA